MEKQIKKDMVQAMKDKDVVKKDILRVLMGELQRAFITEDADVVKTVKKMVSNLKETGGDEDEINILEAYLPKQMSDSEMKHKVKEVVNDNNLDSMAGMGLIMSYFKNNFDGTYDGRALSAIVRAELA